MKVFNLTLVFESTVLYIVILSFIIIDNVMVMAYIMNDKYA